MKKGLQLDLVMFYLGRLLVVLGLSEIIPLLWAVYYQESVFPFLVSGAATIGAGIVLSLIFKHRGVTRYREAFALVSFCWLAASLFGSLPYLLSGAIAHPVDAFFETMSGFTTTGASILVDIEALPRGILFWRSLTHWLGGMGIIVLIVALLSQLGVGANQVLRAEVPGPVDEKLTPRIMETARILWLTYVVLTALETILLMVAGMTLFDALCHTFGTVATGGFSTKNASLGFYSPVIQWIIVVFMIFAGTNFALYYRALRNLSLRNFWRDTEFRVYLLIFALATVLVISELQASIPWGEELLRTSAFQVVSIMTTTGYATSDFAVWPLNAQIVLIVLMFIGGCSGSTGGSIKVGRILILIKQSILEMKRLIHPRGVFSVHYGKKSISSEIIINVMQFFFLYMVIFAMASLIICSLENNMIISFSSVAATFGNIGPGLGPVGPTSNYFGLTVPSKIILSFLMLLGRLEIYTVLVLLSPAFWKS